MLNAGEQRVDFSRNFLLRCAGATAGQTEHGIEFVDGSVSLDSQVVFANTRPAKQAGVAGIASFCVDFHGSDIWRAGVFLGITLSLYNGTDQFIHGIAADYEIQGQTAM